MNLPDRIILVGPSGSGKSHLASLIAQSTGHEAVDIDATIEVRIGMTIAEFFERFGEAAFRTIETEILRDACSSPGRVVATGGGAVLAPANWALMRPGSVIVGLTARSETLVERVLGQQERLGLTAERPNMAGDPKARMDAMLASRAPFYDQADVTVDTEGRDVDEVLRHALAAIEDRADRNIIPKLSIDTAVERSDLYVSRGVRREMPELVRQRWPRASRIWIVSDENVARQWLLETRERAEAAGLDVREVVVPAGEKSKSIGSFGSTVEMMTASGVSRTDVVLALGGGVVGDLSGFVAASCLRGLSLVQMPTSLLAMVDSSIGGKTGINTAAGKNMVGAFYQPGLVLIDSDFLGTLSAEEYRSGMAEVIKHAAIQPSTPLQSSGLADQLFRMASIDPIPVDQIDDIVLQNVRTKHSVVEEDEREAGLRMILNFGHTAGHAIEADGYRYRHGEAVALGMLVATHISIALDLCGSDRFSAIEEHLLAAGLPTSYEGEIATVLENMKSDKKNLSGVQRWILPVGDAGVEVRTGIELELVADALRAIGGR